MNNSQQQLTGATGDEQEDNVAEEEVFKIGHDMDQEYTNQNFQNIARQGDLSPRQIEKAKSAAKGKKKQHKESNTAPTGGVQTRRTLTKSLNQ